MKVDIFLPHFPPSGGPIAGGTAKATYGLSTALSALGVEVTVLCEGEASGSIRVERGYKIECFQRHATRNPFNIPPALARYFTDPGHRPVTLLNGIFHPKMYAASRALRRAGKPYVQLPHDPLNDALFVKRAFVKRVYWHAFERRFLSQAVAIQVLDPRHEAFLQACGVSTKVICVPNGYSEEDVLDSTALRWRTDGPVKLVFLGRLDQHNKGLDLLLGAFGQLSLEHALELHIQGPISSDASMLQQLANQTCANGTVIFRDADFASTPASILLDHDVACFPSRFEGFGLAALEAMLAARVVLVSEVAGIAPHIARAGCGVVVEPRISDVLKGLRQLLSRRTEWKEMGMRGRAYALSNLTWRAAAVEAVKEYRTLKVA